MDNSDNSYLIEQEDEKVLDVLRKHKEVMGLTIFDLEKISLIACINNIESDLGDIYILDVIVEEDHMRYKDEVDECKTHLVLSPFLMHICLSLSSERGEVVESA